MSRDATARPRQGSSLGHTVEESPVGRPTDDVESVAWPASRCYAYPSFGEHRRIRVAASRLLPERYPNTRRAIAAITYGGEMNRITVDPKVMGGVPCLRGLRIPVATVVNMVAGGLSVQEIVDELPPLEADDVAAALRFAADAVSDREILLRPTA